MHADAVQLSMLLYIMSPGIVLLAALVFHQASAFGPYLRVYPPVNTSDGRTPLYFGLVQSLGSSNFDGSGSVAGVEVALDLINSDTNVLPEYTLHYTLGNSSVGVVGTAGAGAYRVQGRIGCRGVSGNGKP